MRRKRTNWKYIFILLILASIVGGILYWQSKTWPKEEVSVLKIKKPKRIEVTEELANKIIEKILPENFDRKTACFFIDDLDNDQISELLVSITPTPPTFQAYFVVVSPTDEIGNYKKIADFKFGKKENINFRSTPCVFDKNDLVDIDGDGKKELVLDLGTGGANNEAYGVFRIDWDLKKIEWLKIKRKDGETENSFFLRGGSVMHQEVFEIKDLDLDGKMELIEREGEYLGGDWEKEENWKWQISVYKWDGEIFEYNQELSNGLLEK